MDRLNEIIKRFNSQRCSYLSDEVVVEFRRTAGEMRIFYAIYNQAVEQDLT